MDEADKEFVKGALGVAGIFVAAVTIAFAAMGVVKLMDLWIMWLW